MKSWWTKIESRIDALGLRERAMAFAVAALILVSLFSVLVIDPLSAREKKLSQQIRQDQQQIAALQAEIQARVNAHRIDPDAANRTRLQQLQRESGEIRDRLKGMQKGLVAPEKMTALLEDLLKRDRNLQLRSLKTLPVSVISAATAETQAPGKNGPKDNPEPQEVKEAVYKHSVQIVVRGGYLDLMRYLTEIEELPWQVFWEKASLDAREHPGATLTLTLFTLSLEKKWLNI